MTTPLARRFAIVCLSCILFALGLLMVVQSHARPPHFGQIELDAPCPQPLGIQCKARS
jgi:hypothetical protein